MPFKSVADIAAAYENGRWHHQRVYRNTSIYANVGLYVDYSMSGGNPKYNAYVGNQLESTALIGAGNNGIYKGATPAAGETKHIAKILYGSPSTLQPVQRAMLCDYLLFYPLIDGDNTDLQEFINTEPLPRYADGVGVQMALVQTGGSPVAGAFATITYTNSAGIAGQTTTVYVLGSASTSGLAHAGTNSAGAVGPHINLAGGDVGVRSIESLQFAGGTGAFYALLLFKPLANIQMLESATVAEIDYVNQRLSLPCVYDDAYLSFISMYSASASSTSAMHAGIDFIWG